MAQAERVFILTHVQGCASTSRGVTCRVSDTLTLGGPVMFNRLVLIAELGTEPSWLLATVAGPDTKSIRHHHKAKKNKVCHEFGCGFGWSVKSPPSDYLWSSDSPSRTVSRVTDNSDHPTPTSARPAPTGAPANMDYNYRFSHNPSP